MFNIGLIGCGKIAQVRHLPEYTARRDCKISAVYDTNNERAMMIALQYGAIAYTSYERLLADPSLDAISVCTANFCHAEISIAALKAGKHVLCEKPMATTLEDCQAMVDAAKEANRVLMIGQNQRLNKTHVVARKLLSEGCIGKILTFKTCFGHGGPETWSVDSGKDTWFFDKSKASMGAMADLGAHKTDLIRFLTGRDYVSVTAYTGTLDKKDSSGNPICVDDNAICIFRMEEGIVGTMTASWTYYGDEDNSTVIYGTEGVMHIYDDPNYSIVVEKRTGERIKYQIDKIATNVDQNVSGVIDRFVNCLHDPQTEGISGAQVLNSMRAIFAAIESAQTGTTINIRG